MKKRILSFLLVFCMLVSAFSMAVPAFAMDLTAIEGEILLTAPVAETGATSSTNVIVPTGAKFTAGAE